MLLEDETHQTRDRANLANQIMTRQILNPYQFSPSNPSVHFWRSICTSWSLFDRPTCSECMCEGVPACDVGEEEWKSGSFR